MTAKLEELDDEQYVQAVFNAQKVIGDALTKAKIPLPIGATAALRLSVWAMRASGVDKENFMITAEEFFRAAEEAGASFAPLAQA